MGVALQGQDIICISSIDWDFIWQGHQEIMSALAERGNRVLFIENTGIRPPSFADLPRLKKRIFNWWRGTKGFRKEQENLFIYSPLVLPFPYSRVARRLNRLILEHPLKSWMRAMGFSRPIVWTFLPTPLSLSLIPIFDPKVTVYYCIDSLAQSSFWARRITKFEVQTFKQSDLVFVTSHHLSEYARQHHPRVEIFPFGVDVESFEKVRSMPADVGVPAELNRLPRPVAGYVGGIHKWLDQRLIVEVASRLPNVSFVFVGPIQTDVGQLRKLSNVYLLGARSHEEVPYYIRAFDLCLIPYAITNYTNNVYPTKLNEYLAMGKPVVSTDLDEIRRFNRANGNMVLVAGDSRQFAETVVGAAQQDTEGLRAARVSVADRNSWQRRVEEMAELIQDRLDAVERSSERTWEERLLEFYRGSRRQVAVVGGTLLLLYLLLFQTPFVWHLAEPLRIVDQPRSSDAIVVFAGGVGESGLAGEGYKERVKQAVDLYHSRFARRLIFSSGYAYAFQEADVMKALAVSLGVPADAIVLEKRAGSTYENVKFVGDILNQHQWQSILLVSSPYHMRRASLVFHKFAPHIQVTHTPVAQSLFYEHGWGASLSQVRGILQEYAAIVYYWWRKWI